MRVIRLSFLARADIAHILHWSQHEFGDSARLRYEALMGAALRDLSADPHRPTTRERPELGAGVMSYHLSFSRRHVPPGTGLVRRPRHLMIYRLDGEAVVSVARILHDSMELLRHLPAAFHEDAPNPQHRDA